MNRYIIKEDKEDGGYYGVDTLTGYIVSSHLFLEGAEQAVKKMNETKIENPLGIINDRIKINNN